MVVNFWGSLFASHIIDLVLNKWTSPKYQYLQTKKKKKKNPQQNISKLTQQDTKGIILHAWDLSEDMGKSFTVIRHHRTEDQGHAIISIDAEVVCAKS